MLDLYRKSILSQLGKDAGNQTMSDYIRNITTNYVRYLSAVQTEKEKQSKQPTQTKNGDFGLYL